MELTREQIEAAEERAGIEVSIYENYSGRGMYGAKCLGFTLKSAGAWAALTAALAANAMEYGDGNLADDIIWGASRAESDSMGLEGIYYVRDWSLAAEEATA